MLKKIFGRPKGEKISWRALSPQKKDYFIEHVSNGCGTGGGWMNRFLSKHLYGKQKKASCDIHDFYHVAGGNIIDFLEAQFIMWAKQIEDAFDRRDLAMFLTSFIYVIGTTTFGGLFFRWGDYATEREIFGTSFDDRVIDEEEYTSDIDIEVL